MAAPGFRNDRVRFFTSNGVAYSNLEMRMRILKTHAVMDID